MSARPGPVPPFPDRNPGPVFRTDDIHPEIFEVPMPCGKKRKRAKMATHKRKKRRRLNRHKKKLS